MIKFRKKQVLELMRNSNNNEIIEILERNYKLLKRDRSHYLKEILTIKVTKKELKEVMNIVDVLTPDNYKKFVKLN